MVAFLANLPRRVIAVGAVFLIGALIAFSQAVIALTGDHERPKYKNAPDPGLAPAQADTLISPSMLSRPRLPDDDLIALASSSVGLTRKALDGTLDKEGLKQAGLVGLDADETLREIENIKQSMYGREIIDVSRARLTSVGAKTAAFQVDFRFGVGPTGSPPLDGFAELSFTMSGAANWTLTGLALRVS